MYMYYIDTFEFINRPHAPRARASMYTIIIPTVNNERITSYTRLVGIERVDCYYAAA